MSHTAEMTTNYLVKNEKELIESLKEHFEDVEVHEELTQMKMFNGAVSLATYGEAGKAHIIIRRKTQEKALGHASATNDLGFVRNEDGTISMLVDPAGFPKAGQDKIAMEYAARVATKQLKKQGYSVKRTVENGVVRIKAGKYQ